MKMIILILLLLCSCACKTLEPQWTYHSSETFKTCYRWKYDLNKLKKVEGTVEKLPIEACNNVRGFKFDELADPIMPWIKLNRRRCEDAMNDKEI